MAELKKLSQQKQAQAAGDLTAERNRARAKAQTSQAGDPLRRMGAATPTPSSAPEGGRYADRMAGVQQKQAAGQPLSLGERVAVAGKMRAERFKAKKQKEERKKPGLAERLAGKPQYTISLGRWTAFLMVAMVQDLVPSAFIATLVLAKVGVIFQYILLPFTWFFYWYLIIRLLPWKLKRKFWLRSALISAAGLLPVIGGLLPEWIATAIGGWILYNRYRMGKASLTSATSTTKALAEGKAR